MDTTTQKGKILSMRNAQRSNKKWLPALTPVALLLMTQFSHAQGLNASASVEGSTILQNRHSDVRNEELVTFSVKPEGILRYDFRTFSGTVIGSVTHLERDSEDVARKDTFSEFSYNANWQAIDHILSFRASGNQSYIDGSGGDFLISDYFLNAETLAKVETQNYGAYLTIPEGDWIAGGGSLVYAKTNAEESEFRPNIGLNNDSAAGSLYLMNGDNAQNYFWNLNSTYTKLERSEESGNGDYIGKYATGALDSMLYNDWGIRVTASYDANELVARTDEFSNEREFKSYGVGITYREAAGRYISVTANKVDSDVERDDGDVFVGVDAAWALTPRTSVQASIGRRFYGRSASAGITYNTRKIRGAVNYSEQVTSFSQLIATPQSLGVFVCPTGDFTADACFQPSSLDYTLGDDEQFLQFITTGLELSNAIFLRKAANGEFGIQGRRGTIVLNLQYADDEYLDFDQQRKTYSANLSSSYQLSRHSSLLGNLRYGVTEQMNNGTDRDSEQWFASVGLRRTFSRYFSGDVETGYVTRSGSLATSAYGADYNERRISVTIRYDFE